MQVKTKERQISFLFQEQDPFFEIGFRVLEQEQIQQMLPYQRKQHNGREKLMFKAENENLVPLAEVAPKLTENELISLMCGMLSLNIKVEENGFLRKECIWYQYDNLYYDMAGQCIMAAILPITGEIRYVDDSSWYNCFEETITRIAAHIPYDKMVYVRKLVQMLRMGKMTQEAALEELARLGDGVAGRQGAACEMHSDIILRLLYRGKGRELEFEVSEEDFLIGRNAEVADGVIPLDFSRAVSRKHCLITRLNNKYFVQDLKSVNHTLVNGIMIPPYELMELENNDILSVADIEFRVMTVRVSQCNMLEYAK